MDLNVEKEGAQLIEVIDAVDEEMDLASEEDATIEDIEGAKSLAAELIDRYDELLKRLSTLVHKFTNVFFRLRVCKKSQEHVLSCGASLEDRDV